MTKNRPVGVTILVPFDFIDVAFYLVLGRVANLSARRRVSPKVRLQLAAFRIRTPEA
jgi:hypothetical protein